MMIYNYKGKDFIVNVLYKPANRHMYLRYKGNEINLSTFKRLKERDVIKILDNSQEILDKIIINQPKDKPNDIVHIFGVEYKINVIEAKDNRIELTDTFNVYTKNVNNDYIKKIIREYYILETKKYIISVFDKYFLRYQELNRPFPTLKFKYLKTCYGKCYPTKNEITFSGLCLRLDPFYIEYVICHELAHMKYLGHQKNFYDYLEKKYPDCLKISRRIRRLRYKDIY